MAAPVISIVAVGRNDNYGGDFRLRLQAFMHWTVARLSQHEIPSEVIFVNYNPVEASPIDTFIDWPTSDRWVQVRVITVPSNIHAKVVQEKGVKDVPVLEYVAKNVGIRRARGEFILAMNPDILVSNGIFDQLNQLSDKCYYRANRLDHSGPHQVKMDKGLHEQLNEHVTAIWFKGRCYSVNGLSFGKYAVYRFRSAVSNRWRRLTVHLRPLLDLLSIPVYYDNIEYRYHCNASGDFMLMHRDAWNRLKGYDETSYISLHVDSLMVLQAAFSGLHGKTFRQPIYHRNHKRRFDAVNKDSEDQQLVYERFKENVEKMCNMKEPVIYNDDQWGLSDEDLPEWIA